MFPIPKKDVFPGSIHKLIISFIKKAKSVLPDFCEASLDMMT